MGDAAQRMVEVGELARAAGIVAQGLRVPRARVDAHAPARGQRAPVAPHGRTLALLVGGLMKGKRLDAARIEPGVENVDDLALARGLLAGDHEQDGKRGGLELDLHLHKRRAQFGHARLVFLPG
jgi:hypothetical protein